MTRKRPARSVASVTYLWPRPHGILPKKKKRSLGTDREGVLMRVPDTQHATHACGNSTDKRRHDNSDTFFARSTPQRSGPSHSLPGG